MRCDSAARRFAFRNTPIGKREENSVLEGGSAEHLDEVQQMRWQRLEQLLRDFTAEERSFIELRSRGAEDDAYAELLGVTEDTVQRGTAAGDSARVGPFADETATDGE